MSRGIGKRLKLAKKRTAQQQDKNAESIADMWRRLAYANGKRKSSR